MATIKSTKVIKNVKTESKNGAKVKPAPKLAASAKQVTKPAAKVEEKTAPTKRKETMTATLKGMDVLVRPTLDGKQWKGKASGLKVWEVKEGTGTKVTKKNEIEVHYTGWYADDKGTILDSSVVRGEPVVFELKDVIKGWIEGIEGMKTGGIRRLYVPADLAYGKEGTDGIRAGTDLVFEIKLLKIVGE